MIVLDASILIAYLDSDDTLHAAAEALLAREIDDAFAANALTLTEVLVVPARAGRLEPVLSVLRELDVEALPFPLDTAVRARADSLKHGTQDAGLLRPAHR